MIPGMQEAYEEACRKHGHTAGRRRFFPDRDTPSVDVRRRRRGPGVVGAG